MHDISGLDLVLCSDYITNVSLGKALYLRKDDTENNSNKDLISRYRNRPIRHESLSLHDYFYDEFLESEFYEDSTTKRKKNRILIPKGLNCRARFPVDYDYARGMLIMHRPWSKRNPLKPLLEDEESTIGTFFHMLEDEQFPTHVLAEYHRAVECANKWQYECVAKKGKPVEVDFGNMTEEEMANHEYWENCNCLSAQNNRMLNDKVGEQRVDLGIDHDWTKLSFKGERAGDHMDPETYTDYLKAHFYSDQSDREALNIPKTKCGGDYRVDSLNAEQQLIVISAMEAIVKFLNNDETYKPLRATVVGCGGTGKSYIINTLISLIRRYTGLNDTVKVAAPSGGAAYNVGGCTLHRCLNLSVDAEKLCSDLTPEKQDELTGQLRNLLMLIIDERSMISSMLLAGAERNVRHCAFGKQNMTEQWAGIPVVLIFGDDYQLMPVSAEGAITGYARRLNLWNDKPTKKKPKQQLQIDRGTDLFINGLTEEVFHLTENYRSIKDPIYADILARLRKGDSTKEDGERLIRQRWDKQKKRDSKWAKETENNPKTVFLFTRNDERKAKNREKLVDLSEETCLPVARMSCMWSSNRQSGGTVYRSHFNSTNMVLQTDLCIGSTVTLSGINIVPEAGLYNGARGIVIDFLFDEKTGPNNKDGDHLPKCVVVDFPGLKLGDAKPWDRNNPTVRTHFPDI